MDMDNTMLSRSGRSDPGGKLSVRWEISVSEELDSIFTAIAVVRRRPKAEVIRSFLERIAFGEAGMLERLHAATGGELPGESPGQSMGR